ncbi:hypothetical protein VTK26DRAFT_3121 [Humicola hyalothermophila]
MVKKPTFCGCLIPFFLSGTSGSTSDMEHAKDAAAEGEATDESKPPNRPDKIPLQGNPATGVLSSDGSHLTISWLERAGLRTNSSREPDYAQTLLAEMEQLRVQLRAANDRAERAERAAADFWRQLGLRATEATGDKDLADSITTLKAENKQLRADLDDARSHIFSLQPYRKDLIPDEVGQEYDHLVNGVTDWVTKLVEPVLDDEEKLDEILTAAMNRSLEIQKLRKCLRRHGDLIHGSVFPDTDIDILIAIIMRFLLDDIFRQMLIGAVPHIVEVLSHVEASMQTNVAPKRDLFALRTWRAETLNAVIHSHDYQRARSARIEDLAFEVVAMFEPFTTGKDWSKLCASCRDQIIQPAVELHEKLLTATHHFYLDLNPYIVWNARQEPETSPDFVDNLPNLKCENVLQNRRPFNVDRLDPRPAREQLQRELTHVAAVVPGLYMRQVGRGDAIREPTVVRRQQVLVAWGPPERREKVLAGAQRTLVHRLYYCSREKV